MESQGVQGSLRSTPVAHMKVGKSGKCVVEVCGTAVAAALVWWRLEQSSKLARPEAVDIGALRAEGATAPLVVDIEAVSREMLADALERAHEPHEVLIEGSEGHGFDQKPNRFEAYLKMLDFLARNTAS